MTATYLDLWGLVQDGRPVETPSSVLMPVRRGDERAMLKVARVDEERRGGGVMAWWAGRGAVRVLEHDDTAVLLERAVGPRSLAIPVASGLGTPGWEREDAHATEVLCDVARTLHAVDAAEPERPPGVVPLDRWFRDLLAVEGTLRGFLHRSAVTARELLADPWDETVLHGDLHHGNVLDTGTVQSAQWRVIDPKGLVGERGFDYANIVCNPTPEVAVSPGRLERQVEVISAAADLDRDRLLRWVVAWTGLSYVWHTSEDTGPDGPSPSATAVLTVGRAAEQLLRDGQHPAR